MKKSDSATKTQSIETTTLACKQALEKVQTIIKSERAAKRFFFVEMRPKMAALAANYTQSTGEKVTVQQVCTLSYLTFWENDWERFRSFKGQTTPHAWVADLTSQALHRRMVEDLYIKKRSTTQAKDYRLKIRHIKERTFRSEIVEMVEHPMMRKALELYYVDKASDSEMASAFGGDAATAAAWLKKGERKLIDRLLYTNNPYGDIALSLKENDNGKREEAWDDEKERMVKSTTIDDDGMSDELEMLHEALTVMFGVDDPDANVAAFVGKIADKLGWNDQDRVIWELKAFEGKNVRQIAEQLGLTERQANYRLDKLQRAFNSAFRAWWSLQNHTRKAQ